MNLGHISAVPSHGGWRMRKVYLRVLVDILGNEPLRLL